MCKTIIIIILPHGNVNTYNIMQTRVINKHDFVLFHVIILFHAHTHAYYFFMNYIRYTFFPHTACSCIHGIYAAI